MTKNPVSYSGGANMFITREAKRSAGDSIRTAKKNPNHPISKAIFKKYNVK